MPRGNKCPGPVAGASCYIPEIAERPVEVDQKELGEAETLQVKKGE